MDPSAHFVVNKLSSCEGISMEYGYQKPGIIFPRYALSEASGPRPEDGETHMQIAKYNVM